MEVTWVEFAEVDPAAYNPRVDLLPGDAEWRQIEASLDEYGQVEPLVYNAASGRLVSGHQRMRILAAKGETGAHMSVVTITDEQREKALNVALNQGGRWDLTKLSALMGELDPAGLAVIAGFDESQLAALAAEMEAQGQAPLDASRGGSEPLRQPRGDAAGPLALRFTDEQTRIVREAIETAREQLGSESWAAAVTEICAFFNSHARGE